MDGAYAAIADIARGKASGVTDTTRLQLELADALGVTQAVRAAATDAAARVDGGKLRKRLTRIDADLAPLQEEVNALVVADRSARTRLTGRSRRLRDAETAARPDESDGLDALQALAAEAAYALSQWSVVRRLAKGAGDKPAAKLAKRALPLAEEHLETALRCCDRAAKRQVRAARAARG